MLSESQFHYKKKEFRSLHNMVSNTVPETSVSRPIGFSGHPDASASHDGFRCAAATSRARSTCLQ